MGVQLGNTVYDRLSGFRGIATGRAEFLWGCNRIEVTPQELDKEGKPMESRWFDESRIVITASTVFPQTEVEGSKPGGPDGNATRHPDPVR